MLWNTLPEKYHIGFQHPGTAHARRYPKRVDAIDVGISVGGNHRASAQEIGIVRLERSLNRFPRMIRAAIQAPYSAEVAMQLDDVDASSPLVEPVNILRDQLL